MTDAAAPDHLQFERRRGFVEDVALLSDGIEPLVLHYASRSVHAPFFERMFPTVRRSKAIGQDLALSQELETYLWPTGILHADSRVPQGLMMPRISGCKDIHKLYSPRSRKSEFRTADFRFLLCVATNIARAFAMVHQGHCIIGDVNHGSIIVAENATVRLIDCDSFQVTVNGHTYLCEVGVPTFTPPELQGRPFRGIVRTTNHDNFGLAVLIFHLLFMDAGPLLRVKRSQSHGLSGVVISTARDPFQTLPKLRRLRSPCLGASP